MATIKAYTDISQSKKLAEILPLESADMAYIKHSSSDNPTWEFNEDFPPMILGNVPINEMTVEVLPCWSLAALLSVLPEINSIPLKVEKVKAEDGYNGYYYHIEYEDILLIPYSKNPVDACYQMVIKLKENNLI